MIKRLEEIMDEIEAQLEEQNDDFKATHLRKALFELDLVVFCLKMIED